MSSSKKETVSLFLEASKKLTLVVPTSSTLQWQSNSFFFFFFERNKAGVHPGPSLTEHLSRISHINCCWSLTLGANREAVWMNAWARFTLVLRHPSFCWEPDTSMIELNVLAGMGRGLVV